MGKITVVDIVLRLLGLPSARSAHEPRIRRESAHIFW